MEWSKCNESTLQFNMTEWDSFRGIQEVSKTFLKTLDKGNNAGRKWRVALFQKRRMKTTSTSSRVQKRNHFLYPSQAANILFATKRICPHLCLDMWHAWISRMPTVYQRTNTVVAWGLNKPKGPDGSMAWSGSISRALMEAALKYYRVPDQVNMLTGSMCCFADIKLWHFKCNTDRLYHFSCSVRPL